MMEGTTTIVDLFAPWRQAQLAFWEPRRAAMANETKPAVPAMGAANLPVEFWKAAIYGGLEAQLVAAEMWKAWICANDANIPELTRGACQLIHFTEDWTRAQMGLWDAWFASLESLAPGMVGQPTAGHPAAKPRAHGHTRRHDTPAPAQPHNGVSA